MKMSISSPADEKQRQTTYCHTYGRISYWFPWKHLFSKMQGTQNGRTWPRRGRTVLSEVCCGDTDVCQVWQSKNKSRSHIFWCPAASVRSSCPVILHNLHPITLSPPVQTVSCHFNPTISCFLYHVHPGSVWATCCGKCWTVCSSSRT